MLAKRSVAAPTATNRKSNKKSSSSSRNNNSQRPRSFLGRQLQKIRSGLSPNSSATPSSISFHSNTNANSKNSQKENEAFFDRYCIQVAEATDDSTGSPATQRGSSTGSPDNHQAVLQMLLQQEHQSKHKQGMREPPKLVEELLSVDEIAKGSTPLKKKLKDDVPFDEETLPVVEKEETESVQDKALSSIYHPPALTAPANTTTNPVKVATHGLSLSSSSENDDTAGGATLTNTTSTPSVADTTLTEDPDARDEPLKNMDDICTRETLGQLAEAFHQFITGKDVEVGVCTSTPKTITIPNIVSDDFLSKDFLDPCNIGEMPDESADTTLDESTLVSTSILEQASRTRRSNDNLTLSTEDASATDIFDNLETDDMRDDEDEDTDKASLEPVSLQTKSRSSPQARVTQPVPMNRRIVTPPTPRRLRSVEEGLEADEPPSLSRSRGSNATDQSQPPSLRFRDGANTTSTSLRPESFGSGAVAMVNDEDDSAVISPTTKVPAVRFTNTNLTTEYTVDEEEDEDEDRAEDDNYTFQTEDSASFEEGCYTAFQGVSGCNLEHCRARKTLFLKLLFLMLLSSTPLFDTAATSRRRRR